MSQRSEPTNESCSSIPDFGGGVCFQGEIRRRLSEIVRYWISLVRFQRERAMRDGRLRFDNKLAILDIFFT
jgi:hypothetical protein